jgi:hypothetical protein
VASLRLADWEARSRSLNNRQLEIQKMREQMSPQARDFLARYLNRLRGDFNVQSQLYKNKYFERPVKIKQFIEDPYYLGNTLGNDIYPKVKESLIELFDGNYFEVLLGGAIGWGKTTMAYIGIAYDIYLVSCLTHPAQTFGLIPGSNVAFLNISVNKKQGQKVMFAGLFNLIKNSPYFREKFMWDKHIETELRFPRNIFAYPVAATEQAILGEGVFSAVFDEMNFYQIVEKSRQAPEGGTFDQAFALYNRMSRRIRSRMNKRGRLPGHLWLVSSARYPSDFTERKAVEALTDTTIFVREYSDWETKPKSTFMQTATGEMATFRVEIGDISRRTRILNGTEGPNEINSDRVIEVPEDYHEVFNKDPDGAARDHAGYPVLTIRPFITRRDLIQEMFNYTDAAGKKHPFSDFTVTLQDANEKLVPEFFKWIEKEINGVVSKSLERGPYFAHIDLALKGDSCGLGVGHISGQRQVKRGFGVEQKLETKPVITVDLLLQIVAPRFGEISISAVRGLLYSLRAMGMHFGMVTYDSWNSADSIQTLKSAGFEAEVLSVDRDPEAYEEAKTAIYDGRLYCYTHPILQKELTGLMFDEKHRKVDHPPNGSKDVSDALAGMVHNCEKAFANGIGGDWQEVLTVTKHDTTKVPRTDQDELMAKIANNIPLNEEEISRL